MKRVAITGAQGTIGTVLTDGLRGYALTLLDLPETDVRDYEVLGARLRSHDVVIHLAWDSQPGSSPACNVNVDNLLMSANVYRAAEAVGVGRVIMASSVHADTYMERTANQPLKPDQVPVPDSPYGAAKVFIEALGRHYAQYGLEVVCIRFGGINSQDTPDVPEQDYAKAWLSHRDCITLLSACVEAPRIPGGYLILYGVSNNADRVHDWSNPLGWAPRDDAQRRTGR